MRFFYGVLTTLTVLALAGVLFVYSGVYNVAASDNHASITQWALHTAMHQSVKARAGDVTVPRDLVSEARVEKGARAYDQLCAACHLKPGQSDSLIRQGLNPMPPSLAREGHWTAGEQFWIIKHGIKMTGMPGWGETHDDEALWEITAFLQRLPSLSEAQYTALAQPRTAGGTPVDDGHDHEHMDMSGVSADQADHHAAGAPGGDGHHDGASGDDNHHGGDDLETGATSTQGKDADAEADDHYADGHTH